MNDNVKFECGKFEKFISCLDEYLKEKGELIYATCSIFDEENRKIIEEFLQKNPNFEQVQIDIQKYKEYMDEKGNIQLYQGIENDGFFISKLCKK